MALSDLERLSEDFDQERERFAEKARALIDKRLMIIRKIVPGAEYIDGMGTSFLRDKDASKDEDAAYAASENVFYRQQAKTEESYGEPLPEYLEKARILTEKHGELIHEIFDIGTYLNDTLGYTYS